MKYIRTKDAVMEYEKAIENIKYWFKNVAFEDDEYNIDTETDRLNKSIIKQADTIEELCDSYVITSKQGTIYDSYGDYGYELKEVLPQAREEYPDEDWDLYGCILVNGIIKQVAKFNDEKGKFELL